MKDMDFWAGIWVIIKNLYPQCHANPKSNSKKFSILFSNNILIEYAKALWWNQLKVFTVKHFHRFLTWIQHSLHLKKQLEAQKSVNVHILDNIDETFLKVSSESWLVFDYRRDTYTRGWRVSEKGDFSGMMRFLLLKVFH